MPRFARWAVVWPMVILVSLFPAIARAQDDDDGEKGTITLQVGGQDVEIATNLCYLLNTDSGYPDGYELAGEGVFLTGQFDVNADGKYDEDDKVEYDEDDENVDPKSVINKIASVTPTTENPDVMITIPGLGQCEVVGGTVTIRSYKVSKSDTEDHWSGDIELIVKTPDGAEQTLAGTFDSGITGVW
jgi:hypothetical protein